MARALHHNGILTIVSTDEGVCDDFPAADTTAVAAVFNDVGYDIVRTINQIGDITYYYLGHTESEQTQTRSEML